VGMEPEHARRAPPLPESSATLGMVVWMPERLEWVERVVFFVFVAMVYCLCPRLLVLSAWDGRQLIVLRQWSVRTWGMRRKARR